MTMTNQEFEQQFRNIELLVKHWESLLPLVKTPVKSQFALWLRLNNDDVETVMHGITQTAKKSMKVGTKMDQDFAVRFASGCMRNRSRDRAA